MMTHDLVFHIPHVTQAILPLLIGLIAGAAQAAGNEQKEAGQRYEKAAAERMSPWSKLPIPGIQQANPMGDILKGGFAGLQYGQQNPADVTGTGGGTADGTESALESIPAGQKPNAIGRFFGQSAPQVGGGQGALAGMQGGASDPASLNALQATKRPFSPWMAMNGFGGY